MKYCFLCWLLLLLSHSGYAQVLPPAAAVPSDSTIKVTVVQNGRYSSSLYTINNEPITHATLLALLKKDPGAAALLHKDRVRKRWAYALLPVFIGGLIIGGIQVDNAVKNNPYEPGSNFSKAPVPFSIGLAAFFGSIGLAVSNHFGEAIEVYNKHRHEAN